MFHIETKKWRLLCFGKNVRWTRFITTEKQILTVTAKYGLMAMRLLYPMMAVKAQSFIRARLRELVTMSYDQWVLKAAQLCICSKAESFLKDFGLRMGLKVCGELALSKKWCCCAV